METVENSAVLRRMFDEGRTFTDWQEKSVDHSLLQRAYDLAKMGPTSANCSPMRVVFVSSIEGKARLNPCLAEGNVEKTMRAPVTAIIAQDTQFYERLPELFPHADAKSWFEGNQELIDTTAFRNSTLQAAYFLLALRGVGLDRGAISGFNNGKVDEEFFPDGRFTSNFLLNIGYGDPSTLHARDPRLDFSTACQIL